MPIQPPSEETGIGSISRCVKPQRHTSCPTKIVSAGDIFDVRSGTGRKSMKLIQLCALAGALAVSAPALAQQQLSIATGGTGGAYYPIGGGLAELITENLEGYSAVAEVTGASVENMALIHQGAADFAIALGDSVYQAYSGTGAFEVQQVDVLSLGALYPNAVQIVVPAESDIQSIADLAGKRVSVG